jgi:hypothetical protein
MHPDAHPDVAPPHLCGGWPSLAHRLRTAHLCQPLQCVCIRYAHDRAGRPDGAPPACGQNEWRMGAHFGGCRSALACQAAAGPAPQQSRRQALFASTSMLLLSAAPAFGELQCRGRQGGRAVAQVLPQQLPQWWRRGAAPQPPWVPASPGAAPALPRLPSKHPCAAPATALHPRMPCRAPPPARSRQSGARLL